MQQLLTLDGNILLFIQNHIRQDWMDKFWLLITSLGYSGIFWIALTVILLCFKRTRKVGVVMALSLVLNVIITNIILKNAVARIRPYEVVEGLKHIGRAEKSFSFPSGHSAASFAAAVALYKTGPKKMGVPAIILAILIAFSRLYLGVHYPSDVLAGTLIGIGSAMVMVKIEPMISKKYKLYKDRKNV